MLTFGAGPHVCLGQNIGRAELEEALVCFSLRGYRACGLPGPNSSGSRASLRCRLTAARLVSELNRNALRRANQGIQAAAI